MTDVLSGPAYDLDTTVDVDIDDELVCRHVVPVTHDVTSFVLESPRGQQFAFDAGQYVTIGATIDGQWVERCYTISSPSTRTDRLTITVKRVPGGPMSNWLHDHFRAGDRLRVTGPLGQFSTVVHSAPKYLFLSAGSGITPLMSMTRTLLDDDAADVVFLHSARTPHDIVFRDELEQLDASTVGVRVATICEDDARDERWTGPLGRLTSELLHSLVPDLDDREIFTCGPQPYMASVRPMLQAAGVDASRCHEESFTLGGAPAAPVVAAAPTGFVVDFRRSGRAVTTEPGETVLQAGLRAGVPLPSSCGEGMCGTCKTSVFAGSVDMQHNGGIRPKEIAANKILLCCSRPLDDLVVDA